MEAGKKAAHGRPCPVRKDRGAGKPRRSAEIRTADPFFVLLSGLFLIGTWFFICERKTWAEFPVTINRIL